MRMDLSALPSSIQHSVHITESGETMWPADLVAEVVQAITASGGRVLGLDLRSDEHRTRGLATEVPWFDSHDADASEAELGALQSLTDPGFRDLVNGGYSMVLVTWTLG